MNTIIDFGIKGRMIGGGNDFLRGDVIFLEDFSWLLRMPNAYNSMVRSNIADSTVLYIGKNEKGPICMKLLM